MGFGREASYLISREYEGLSLPGVTVRVFGIWHKFSIRSPDEQSEGGGTHWIADNSSL